MENKSKEAVETNKDIEQLLLSIQKAFDVLVEKRTDLPVPTIRDDTRSPASLRWRQVCLISLKNIRQFWEIEPA